MTSLHSFEHNNDLIRKAQEGVTANLKCPAVDGVKCPKIDERAGQVTPS